MHESTPTPGTGNGSQEDYKWNNNVIQTCKFSQYMARSAGKSVWIHFLESNFPQILILASSYIFETCHLKTSLRLLVLFPMQNQLRSYGTNTKWEQQLALLCITATVLAKVNVGRLRWTLAKKGNVKWRGAGVKGLWGDQKLPIVASLKNCKLDLLFILILRERSVIPSLCFLFLQKLKKME